MSNKDKTGPERGGKKANGHGLEMMNEITVGGRFSLPNTIEIIETVVNAKLIAAIDSSTATTVVEEYAEW